MMGRRGMDLVLVHFDNKPFSDDQCIEKAKKLMKAVDKATGKGSKKVFVPHGPTQEQIQINCSENMQCVLCRRSMFMVAEGLASKYDAPVIITGESMGQVASQTLANMMVEEHATTLPILRPLIGLDKIEIERIAKRIGTYDISIAPSLCCTVAPRRPSTYSSIERAEEEEGRLSLGTLTEREVDDSWEWSGGGI
jgi:thiamine biosynthesis protein ThiI